MQPILKIFTQISDFRTVFYYVLSKVSDNVVRTAYLLELIVHQKLMFGTIFSHACFGPAWLPPCRLHSVAKPNITRYRPVFLQFNVRPSMHAEPPFVRQFWVSVL